MQHKIFQDFITEFSNVNLSADQKNLSNAQNTLEAFCKYFQSNILLDYILKYRDTLEYGRTQMELPPKSLLEVLYNKIYEEPSQNSSLQDKFNSMKVHIKKLNDIIEKVENIAALWQIYRQTNAIETDPQNKFLSLPGCCSTAVYRKA